MRDEQVEIQKQQEEEAPVPVTQSGERVTSIFHGKRRSDSSGKSWMSPASNLPSHDGQCYLPKKLVHTWTGHKKGVSRVSLFPRTGHLLLSASMDSTVKIWDYYGDRGCRMTYTGHSQAVRDAKFSPDGSRFYSIGFDTAIHQWDTETGKILNTVTTGKIPYCLAVHPSEDSSVIVGCQDAKAYQLDMRSGAVTQQYSDHLASVSSVTFVDNGKRIVTTSDDRKIFIWTYGIPVVDKYISEPHMHAVPAVAIHPSGEYFAGQSMNNTIVVYQATGKFLYQGKRRFFGHSSAGYSIQPGFSTDGKYLVSGSSDGQLHFWDWKSTKLYRSLKAHEGVCMDTVWHPHHPSRVISCGWDSTIKLWD